MAYQAVRYMYNNLLDDVSKVTADTQATGRGQALELTSGTGKAQPLSTTAYTGNKDNRLIFEIDSVTAGVSVGQATYRWRWEDSSGWEATGVTTSGTLTAVGLGIKVAWKSHATEDDFALNDHFEMAVRADKGTQNLFDGNPNTIFESTAVDHQVFDWGSAQEVTAVILLNHNLVTGQSTCDFQAHTADSWGTPDYDEALTIADPIIHYPSSPPTKRYARLNPTDGALSEVSYGEVFIGTYLELTANAWWGTQEGAEYLGYSQESQWGLSHQQWLAEQRVFVVQYDWMKDADITSLLTMRAALLDSTTKRVKPLFVHLISDDGGSTLILARWRNWAAFSKTHLDPNRRGVPNLEFVEVPITSV